MIRIGFFKINKKGDGSASRTLDSSLHLLGVVLSGLLDGSPYQHVSLGREFSVVFTSHGPLVYRYAPRRRSLNVPTN
jgi:hypothetical protein